jgi:hypothetical protein
LTAKRSKNTWSRIRRPLLTVFFIIAVAGAVFLYLKVIAPKHFLQKDTEEGMPPIKVQIKNGCGEENLAASYLKSIKKLNLDVISLSDTRLPIYNKTLIEVKKENQTELERLQKMTGIKRFTLAIDSTYITPYIIILGRDYEEYIP